MGTSEQTTSDSTARESKEKRCHNRALSGRRGVVSPRFGPRLTPAQPAGFPPSMPPSMLDQAQNQSIITPTKGGTMPCMKRGTKKAAKKTAKKTTKK